jgi:hypothetical protein
MRHAFFALQNMPPYRIPILIEVRSFNRLHVSDLTQRITDDIASTGVAVTREQVTVALESGIFFILLDGMDELQTRSPNDYRAHRDNPKSYKGMQEHYEAELMTFTEQFPLCPILVSTRPMHRLYSWPQFVVQRISPLNPPHPRRAGGGAPRSQSGQ